MQCFPFAQFFSWIVNEICWYTNLQNRALVLIFAVVPRDCADIQKTIGNISGVYMVYVGSNYRPLTVYCDMNTTSGGWMVSGTTRLKTLLNFKLLNFKLLRFWIRKDYSEIRSTNPIKSKHKHSYIGLKQDIQNTLALLWFQVFQRRSDGSVDFYRNWFNYTQGFGDVKGEFWIGLYL